ncbi:MAG: 50S ribosomal protein L21e [Candidatus Aenigmarchaeota archaeon]|nr:50S ribosomal protein L21e [Candidatus Aenigmarchaeota archaeon]
MVKKSRGSRARTRKKLTQKPRYRPPITKFLQEFERDQRVVILQEPSSQKGMPHPRFKGKIGKIIDKRGKSYIVEIVDGNKVKRIISRPEHLKVV